MPYARFLATYDGAAALALAPTELAASACSPAGLREVFFERTGLDAYILHTGGLERAGQEPCTVRLELAAPFSAPAILYTPLPHARPWQEPGWFREAIARLETVLGETVIGLEPLGTSDLGTVLRVGTASRTTYLKTSERRLEAALTAYLARAHPGLTPKVVDWDAKRNLLLTEDGGTRLNETADLALWQEALTRLAQFQRTADSRALQKLGCPTYPFDDLGSRATLLLQDDRALTNWGMTLEQITALQKRLPTVITAHERVRQLELPLLPAHGDAHPMNVLTGPETSWFDWSDACLAHPFLDIGWFLAWLLHPARADLPLRLCEQDAATRLWQTYLEAIGRDGSASLSDAMLLALIHRALVYHERYAHWQGTLPGWQPQYVPFLLRSLLKLTL